MPPKKKAVTPKEPVPATPTDGQGDFRISYGPDGTPEKVYADGHREPA